MSGFSLQPGREAVFTGSLEASDLSPMSPPTAAGCRGPFKSCLPESCPPPCSWHVHYMPC